MKTDYLVIGAGLAGLVLQRALRGNRVTLVDPSPGGWKIGEANVPEMFATPMLEEIVVAARQLPSFSQKNGSVFVGDDSVAAFPIVSNYAHAMHVARDELEQMLLARWQPEVQREAVEAIDLEAKTVRTSRTTYEVAEQIIDCSGPAMLVASALGEVQKLWPIHSTWRYYDVKAVDPAGFWRHAQALHREALFIDIPKVRLLPDSLRDTWLPHEATNLTKVKDGVWMWQIPLFHARMLSVGLVSALGEVTSDALDEAVAAHHSRGYVLEPRPLTGETVYDRLHQRSGFARRAGRAATMSAILIGDAFTFVDPVYSVGTSMAVNKALEVAALLNHGPWTEEKCATFCARYEALLARRIAAFEYWYREDRRVQDPTAQELRRLFPRMTAFQAGVTCQYAQVVAANLSLTQTVRDALAQQAVAAGP